MEMFFYQYKQYKQYKFKVMISQISLADKV